MYLPLLLLLNLQFLSTAVKEMTCYNNLNAYKKLPDKSVLCLRRKSESMLRSSAHMHLPGSACLLLRNEHWEGEQPDKYFIRLGILTFESLYVFTLNFLKPHHLVSFFLSYLLIFFFCQVVKGKKIRDIHDQFGDLCFAPN